MESSAGVACSGYQAADVSVVVPMWRDEAELQALLPLLVRHPVEVVVAIAERTPATSRLHAQYPGVVWVDADRGRAHQMNAGAAAGHGEWLLFLHADARPDEEWLSEIGRLGADPHIVGGSFTFALRTAHLFGRVIERGVAWRVRWLRLPYGDQGLFVRRRIFERMGGFAPLPLMEDVEFVRRLRRQGPFVTSPVKVRASARRWERDGWLRRTLENLLLILLYEAGVHPARLARIYHRGHRAVVAGDAEVGG